MTMLPTVICSFNTIPMVMPNGVFHKSRWNNSKICMKTQKTWITKTFLRKKNKVGGIIHLHFKVYYEASVIKNSVVQAQKQTHRSMEQNKEPGNESTVIWSTNLWQRRQKYMKRKRQLPQEMVLGKQDSYMLKNQTGLLYHTIYKNKLKMD